MKAWCKTLPAVLVMAFSSVNASNIFSIGVKAGVNFSSISGDFSVINKVPKTGINFGITTDIFLNKNLSFSPEFIYMNKGYAQTVVPTSHSASNNSAEVIDESLTLNYFEIPLLLKVKLENGLHFDGGMYISLLNSADYYLFFIDSTMGAGIAKGTVTEAFKSSDFGVIAGLGYQVEKDIGFNVRYEYSLSDINRYGISNRFANRSVVISLNYYF